MAFWTYKHERETISQVQSARNNRNLTEESESRNTAAWGNLFLDQKKSLNSKPNCKSHENLRDLIILLISLPYFLTTRHPHPTAGLLPRTRGFGKLSCLTLLALTLAITTEENPFIQTSKALSLNGYKLDSLG